MSPHIGQSSQLSVDANHRNAQFLPEIAGTVVVTQGLRASKSPKAAHSGQSSVRQEKLGVSDRVQVPIE